MAWVEADRALIREILGFSALFLQADPRLESAITSVQSTADGGTRPDSSSEVRMRSYMADYNEVNKQLHRLWSKALATQADDVKIDCARGMAVLRSEGRRIVGKAAMMLATHPRYDVFGGGLEPNPEGTPWPELSGGRVGGGPETGW